MNFYEKYIEMCNKIGKAPSAVAIEIGLSKPSVHRWKNGGSPTDATAAKIASYFNVSIDYLKGWEEEEQKEKQPTESELSIKKKEFIKRVEGMTDAQLERLEQILALVERTDV